MNERRKALREKMLRESTQVIQFLLLAGVIVLLGAVTLIRPARTYSAQENRNLAQFPKLQMESAADGSLFQEIDAWYPDQFVLRDKWVSLQAALARISGRKELNQVYIGKDDYLMAKPEVPEAGQIEKVTDAVNAFAKAHEAIRTEVLLVPDAASVMRDRLPANTPLHDQLADLETLRAGLDDSVVWVDGISALQSHAEEAVYYHTDHHWTSLGAKYTFEGAAADLGIGQALTDYEHYTVSDTFEGTLAARTGLHRIKDEIEVYTPSGTDVEYYVNYPDTNEKTTSLFNSEALNQKDQYTVFFGGNHPLVEIHTTSDSDKSLLIFKDSYANSFVQFLYPYYENIIMIDPRYYYENAGSVIYSQKITDVLILYSADTILSESALADCLNAAEL